MNFGQQPSSLSLITLFIVLTIFGVFTESQSTATSSPSPLYITGSLSYAPTQALFYELDIVTGETRNVTTFEVNLAKESQLWGGVIYYETGVFYGLYQNRTNNNCYLYSINTLTGEHLNMAIELPGLVFSIAIDQSQAQIHFLNYTSPSRGVTYGDWSIYDLNTNEFLLVEAGVENNDQLARPSASVYNTETQTLSFLTTVPGKYLYIEFSLNFPAPFSQVSEVAPFSIYSPTYLQMAINPKSNEIYIIGYTTIAETNQTITVNKVVSVENGVVNMEVVCSYEKLDVTLSGTYVMPFQADVDYASNSIVFGENASVRFDVEDYLWVVQLDSCDLLQYSISHTYEIGTPRFYPPSN